MFVAHSGWWCKCPDLMETRHACLLAQTVAEDFLSKCRYRFIYLQRRPGLLRGTCVCT
jgi:hypothetical protein